MGSEQTNRITLRAARYSVRIVLTVGLIWLAWTTAVSIKAVSGYRLFARVQTPRDFSRTDSLLPVAGTWKFDNGARCDISLFSDAQIDAEVWGSNRTDNQARGNDQRRATGRRSADILAVLNDRIGLGDVLTGDGTLLNGLTIDQPFLKARVQLNADGRLGEARMAVPTAEGQWKLIHVGQQIESKATNGLHNQERLAKQHHLLPLTNSSEPDAYMLRFMRSVPEPKAGGSRSGDADISNELHLVENSSRQATRIAGRWSPGNDLQAELVSLNENRADLLRRWQAAGWEIRHTRWGSKASFSFLCAKNGQVVYAWSEQAKKITSLLLCRSPDAARHTANEGPGKDA